MAAGGASQALVPTMEAILGVFLQLLSLWFALAFLLIVLPSVFGLSLGFSEFYLRVLVKILEVSRRGSRKGIRGGRQLISPSPRLGGGAQLAGDDGECRQEH